MRHTISFAISLLFAWLPPVVVLADHAPTLVVMNNSSQHESNTQNTWIRKTPIIPDSRVTFMQAVKLGYIEKVKHYLESGINPDDKQGGKYTALFAASAKGRLKVAELLLASGADVNAIGRGNWTPLMAAAFHGHVSLVKLLLKHKSMLEIKNYEGKTALMFAVENNQPPVVAALIDAGANINAQIHGEKSNGLSVLELAIKHGSQDCLDLLLKAGVNVHRVDMDGITPLVYAARVNNQDAIEKLLNKGARINRIDKESGNGLLHAVAPFVNQETIRFLLEKGAEPSMINKHGHVALALASKAGNVSAMRELLLVAKQEEKNAALLLSAEAGVTDILKELITRGADKNSRNQHQETALMLAVQGRHHFAVGALLEFGAEVNLLNNSGRNALMYAVDASLHRPDIVEKLIERGAAINQRDKQGNTALLLAVGGTEKLNAGTIKVLVEAGADVEIKNEAGDSVRSLLLEHRKRLSMNSEALAKIDKVGKVFSEM